MINDLCGRGWTLIKWGALAAVMIVAVAVPYFNHRVDAKIREQVEKVFCEHYKDLTVSVQSAHLVKGEGIKILGMSFRLPGEAGPAAELARLDEILLKCNTDLNELVKGQPEISEVIIRRPTLRCAIDPEGRPSLAKLLPLPKFGKRPPRVTIENGIVELHDISSSEPSMYVLRDLHATFTPQSKKKNKSAGTGRRGFDVQAHATGDFLKRATIEGSLSLDDHAGRLAGSLEGLDARPELARSLPAVWTSCFPLAESLWAQINATFSLSRDSRDDGPWQFEVQGDLADGRLEHRRLPSPIVGGSCRFRLTPEFGEMTKVKAACGSARIEGDLRGAGLSLDLPPSYRIKVVGLELDANLQRALPDRWQTQWRDFRPEGQVDVMLESSGSSWTPNLTLTCKKVAFTYRRFPYRLEAVTGQIDVRDQVLTLRNVFAVADAAEVRLRGQARLDAPTKGDYVEITGAKIPISERLLDAMPETSRTWVRSLKPHGTIDVEARFGRGDDPSRFEKRIEIDLNRCSMEFDRFPYPLRDVQGKIVANGDEWTFKNLKGVNDTASISGVGAIARHGAASHFTLQLIGNDVPLDGELHDALPAGCRAVWEQLQPQGNVNLYVFIEHWTGQKQPAVRATVTPASGSDSAPLVVRPLSFPYPLEIQGGRFDFRDLDAFAKDDDRPEFAEFQNVIEFSDVRATHSETEVFARGFAGATADGRWNLHFDAADVYGLWFDRDRELLNALPVRLRSALARLQPGGSTNISGEFDLFGGKRQPVRSNWDLHFEFSGARLTPGIELTDIHGGATLAGGYDGESFHARGDLDLDSASYRGWQCTRIMGPLWIDDRQALLGAPASDKLHEESRRMVTAEFYGGSVYGDGRIDLTAGPEFAIDVNLAGVDLERFVRETIGGKQELTGRVTGEIHLAGDGPGVHTLQGNGRLALRNAHVQELPLVVALLDSLSGRRPKSSPFHTCDVNFRLQGEYIYLDPVRLTSDAVTLRGRGEVKLDKSINMTFYSLVGRDEWRIPLVSELAGGASQQMLEVAVRGTLDKPEIEKKILPAVQDLFDRLEADLQPALASGAAAPHVRGGRPANQ